MFIRFFLCIRFSVAWIDLQQLCTCTPFSLPRYVTQINLFCIIIPVSASHCFYWCWPHAIREALFNCLMVVLLLELCIIFAYGYFRLLLMDLTFVLVCRVQKRTICVSVWIIGKTFNNIMDMRDVMSLDVRVLALNYKRNWNRNETGYWRKNIRWKWSST